MDKESKKLLLSYGISVEKYLAWAQYRYEKIYLISGFSITIILEALITLACYDAYKKDPGPPWLMFVLWGSVSLFIVGTIFLSLLVPSIKRYAMKKRPLAQQIEENYQTSYLEYVLKPKYIKKLSPKKIEQIRQFNP